MFRFTAAQPALDAQVRQHRRIGVLLLTQCDSIKQMLGGEPRRAVFRDPNRNHVRTDVWGGFVGVKRSCKNALTEFVSQP